MATQSYEQLISGANKIRQNELPESNTAALVGEQLLQMVNKQQEESRERVILNIMFPSIILLRVPMEQTDIHLRRLSSKFRQNLETSG